jgi:SOS-response transcriptional repressor LexA
VAHTGHPVASRTARAVSIIKKLAEREGKLYLSSVNPMYEDQPFPEDAKIWGPVIAIIRSLTNGYPGRRKL